MRSVLFALLISITIILIIFFSFPASERTALAYLEELRHAKNSFAGLSFLVLASDIFLPVPSSIVMYMNGAVLGFAYGVLLSFVSVLLSSFVGYYTGRLTSIPLQKKENRQAVRILEKWGALGILVTRGIPVLSESVCFVCGYNNYPLKRFTLYSVLGYIPVCCMYAWLGSRAATENLFILSFLVSIAFSCLILLVGRLITTANASATSNVLPRESNPDQT